MLCIGCHTEFGRFCVLAGIKHDLHNRKFCLGCSPIGQRVYPTKVGTLCQCTACGTQYVYMGKKSGASTQRCKPCYGIKARHELKGKAVTYKGGCCIKCGYCKILSAMEFHHRNPLEKDFQIGGNHTRKWTSIQTELDKCDLLCANCHRETHDTYGI